MKKYIGVLFLISCSACSTAELSETGGRVVVVANVDAAKCHPLGYVVGKGGGQFGGAYISNESLMEYAMNDARNKAADKGATHMVLTSGPQMAGYSDLGSTTANVAASIYECPLTTANK